MLAIPGGGGGYKNRCDRFPMYGLCRERRIPLAGRRITERWLAWGESPAWARQGIKTIKIWVGYDGSQPPRAGLTVPASLDLSKPSDGKARGDFPAHTAAPFRISGGTSARLTKITIDKYKPIWQIYSCGCREGQRRKEESLWLSCALRAKSVSTSGQQAKVRSASVFWNH